VHSICLNDGALHTPPRSTSIPSLNRVMWRVQSGSMRGLSSRRQVASKTSRRWWGLPHSPITRATMAQPSACSYFWPPAVGFDLCCPFLLDLCLPHDWCEASACDIALGLRRHMPCADHANGVLAQVSEGAAVAPGCASRGAAGDRRGSLQAGAAGHGACCVPARPAAAAPLRARADWPCGAGHARAPLCQCE
jgi:hypothetical protein